MTEAQALQERRQILLEELVEAADEISRIDKRLSDLNGVNKTED